MAMNLKELTKDLEDHYTKDHIKYMNMIKTKQHSFYSIVNPNFKQIVNFLSLERVTLDDLDIKLQTEELVLKAIDIDEYNATYIKEDFKTKEFLLKAIKVNGFMLHYFSPDLQTYEICLEAVKNNPMALIRVRYDFWDKSIVKEALKNGRPHYNSEISYKIDETIRS